MMKLVNLSERGSRLSKRRAQLEGSIAAAGPHDRRSENRLQARLLDGPRVRQFGALLNLSESGMAVEVPQKCWFARGEAHRLSLRAGSGSVKVDATVRWTQSSWPEGEDSSRATYRQLAGLQFLEPVSDETLSILSILRRLLREDGVDVEVRSAKNLGARRTTPTVAP